MYIIRFSKQADKDKKLLKGAGLDGKEYDGTIKVVRMWSQYNEVR